MFLLQPGGSLKYTYEWEDSMPADVTLETVTYDVGDLALVSEVIDNAGKTSTIQLTGTAHAGLTVVTAYASLSNGEVVPDSQLVIRGMS